MSELIVFSVQILFGSRTVEQFQSALSLTEREPAEMITEFVWTELPDHEWIADVGKLRAFIMDRESVRFPAVAASDREEMEIITLRDQESKSPPIPVYLDNCSSHSVVVNVVMPKNEIPDLPRRTTADPLIE